MNSRFIAAGVAATLAVLAVGFARAQSTSSDVTFEIPLNLTRIHPAVTSFKVSCTITSMGLRQYTTGSVTSRSRSGETIVAVTAGSIVQTIQVVVPLVDQDFSNNASGKPADYDCRLFFHDPGGRSTWLELRHADPLKALTPTPQPLRGSFVW